MDDSVRKFVNDAYVIDGCAFVEYGFHGCDDRILNSGLDAFFLTTPYSPVGFLETVKAMGSIYNLSDKPEAKIKVVRQVEDFFTAKAEGKMGLVFAFQEPKPIENSLDNLRALYELGLRVVQLTYNKANFIGCGCCETRDGGLTDFGRQLIREMNRLGIVVDLSHCGPRTALDALRVCEAPVLYTHANPLAISPSPRNRTDDELRLLAETGGVIGICPWGPIAWKPERHSQPTMEDYIECFDYVVDLIGIDHVGFGTDYILDGGANASEKAVIATLYPTIAKAYGEDVGIADEVRYVKGFRGGPEVANAVDALLKHGYSEEDMRKFLGGNFLRVLKEVWK